MLFLIYFYFVMPYDVVSAKLFPVVGTLYHTALLHNITLYFKVMSSKGCYFFINQYRSVNLVSCHFTWSSVVRMEEQQCKRLEGFKTAHRK